MKILMPDVINQTIELTPRDLTTNYTLELYNEDNRVAESYVSNGIGAALTVTLVDTVSLSLEFDTSIPNKPKNNQSFRLKLIDTDTSQVLWRGKAFATNQVTQNYRINV